MSPAPPLLQFSRSAIASKPGDDRPGGHTAPGCFRDPGRAVARLIDSDRFRAPSRCDGPFGVGVEATSTLGTLTAEPMPCQIWDDLVFARARVNR
jgi:hypothetical protein